MTRIEETFAQLRAEGHRALVPFIVAGDPDLATTHDLIVELARSGAGLIELGVPFSDPMADGPIIQKASERALRNSFGMRDILETVARARQQTGVPIVLFSYYNPLLRFGLERLVEGSKAAGVDGVLVTDLTPEESGEFARNLAESGLDMIYLVAPTSSDERLQMIAARASGFIYAVSRTGVTGTRLEMSGDAQRLVSRVRRITDLPVAVGFGVSNQQHVAEASQYADAVVVGSAIVAEIEKNIGSPDLVANVGNFVRSLMTQ